MHEQLGCSTAACKRGRYFILGQLRQSPDDGKKKIVSEFPSNVNYALEK